MGEGGLEEEGDGNGEEGVNRVDMVEGQKENRWYHKCGKING